jgi:3-oxoacyl-[acyl-carrier-protein] synthase-1
MTVRHLAVLQVGLVTSVGLNAPQSCAAIRAKVTNPCPTGFIDSAGDRITAHQVQLEHPWRGLTKLAKMAAMAIEEALAGIPRSQWDRLPLLLCVAEAERPGRLEGLDDRLLGRIQHELGVTFASQSATVAQGRVGAAVALAQARAMVATGAAPRVVIAAADSLLTWQTLKHYEREDRLLTARSSNGFVPGEGAGALLVGAPAGTGHELICTGIGFGREAAHIDSGEPLRAVGLSQAIDACLGEAGCQMHDLDFRITDNSGEHYYFKEAALAISRTLRRRKAEFDLWHPAECIGEAGALAGLAVIVAASEAVLRNYAKGSNILAHWANDAGPRAAMVLQRRVAA